MNQKKTKFIYLLVLCFLVTQVSLGQTYSSEEESNNEEMTLNGVNVSEGEFNSFFATNTAAAQVQGSSLFLTQIGEGNQARVQVSAQDSDINILQNGNDNDVNLNYEVKSVFTDLQQKGNNNYILDYSFDTTQEISLDLKQNGDNLSFERFGTNEMSKNIKFTQSAASPTIIVRSFN